MKKLLFLLGLTVVVLIIAAGCGDDDCPTCPSNVDTVTVVEPGGYLLWLDGYVLLNPSTEFELDGLANGGAIANIDSFAVGDSVSTAIFMSFWWHSGDPYYYMFWDEDETAPYMYERGDLATVTVWGDNRSSSATVSMLSWTEDATEILVPDGSDTIVDPSNDMEFTWSRVAGSEWYGVELSYTLDSGGVDYFYRNHFDYTLDTSYTVPSTLSGFDVVECYFWVIPVTGPDPESGNGNWVGNYVAGKLFSLGGEDGARVAFVGGGVSKPIVQDRDPIPAPSGREILDGVIATFK